MQIGEEGKYLTIVTDDDVTTYDTMQMEIKNPSGTIFTKAVSTGVGDIIFNGVTYPANQQIRYLVETGFFTVKGKWRARPKLTSAGLVEYGDDWVVFRVTD